MLATPNNYDNNNNSPNINENNELNDSKRDLLIINQNQQPNVKQEEPEQKKEENKTEDVK